MEPPDSLLKSALEKVVFFEVRLEQLTRDHARAEAEAVRLREELAQSSRREIDLSGRVAALETQLREESHGRQDALAQVKALRAERHQWLDKLIDAESIRHSGAELDEGVDLASFISELRSEALKASTGETVVMSSDTVEAAGHKLADQGRLGTAVAQLEQLQKTAESEFKTQSEATLFAFSLKELASPDAASRRRAAERLGTLQSRAAAPALAAALRQESDAEVRAALLTALSRSGDEPLLPLFFPHLSDGAIPVRLAALEACAAVSRSFAPLEAASKDGSPLVRRRVAVLAAGRPGPEAESVLLQAVADVDAAVRRAAALSLAALGPQSRRPLLVALDDRDPTVRRAAARGLSALFHEDLLGVADVDATKRRREIRRLAAAELPKVVLNSPPFSPRPEPPPPTLSPLPRRGAGSPLSREQREPVEASPAPFVEPATLSSNLLDKVALELRASFRGQTLAELCERVGAPEAEVEQVTLALQRAGRLVQRGEKLFQA